MQRICRLNDPLRSGRPGADRALAGNRSQDEQQHDGAHERDESAPDQAPKAVAEQQMEQKASEEGADRADDPRISRFVRNKRNTGVRPCLVSAMLGRSSPTDCSSERQK